MREIDTRDREKECKSMSSPKKKKKRKIAHDAHVFITMSMPSLSPPMLISFIISGSVNRNKEKILGPIDQVSVQDSIIPIRAVYFQILAHPYHISLFLGCNNFSKILASTQYHGFIINYLHHFLWTTKYVYH